MLGHLPKTFTNALLGHGMFAMLPLSPGQIGRLKREHKVFFTGDGRINIAGIPLARVEEMCEKIVRVTGVYTHATRSFS